MNGQDISQVKDLLNITQEPREVVPFDANAQIKEALSIFLQKRLEKLEQDNDFEQEIREAISSRLSEASFNDLMKLLDIFQGNTNAGIDKVLAPFLQKVNSAEDTKHISDKNVGELTKEMSRDLMTAFQELNAVLTATRQQQEAVKKSQDIKEALKSD